MTPKRSDCHDAKLSRTDIGDWQQDPGGAKGDMRRAIEFRCRKCGRTVIPHDPSNETHYVYSLRALADIF